MTKAWKPRITVEVSEHQYNILKEHIPYGMQKQVFGVIIEDLINLLERYGHDVILAILSRQFSLLEQYRKKRTIELLSVS
jgi:hypothetical protein